MAKFADGPTGEASKQRRLLREYRRRKDWFLLRAKAERRRPLLTAYTGAAQAFLESQRHLEVIAKGLERSPLIEEARRLQKQQRMLDNMLKGPFG
jgi:hypothetical protein